MKFTIKKAVAASILLAMGSGAQAAILSGFTASVTGQPDGELFISILRDNASPESMIIDTNVSLFGVRDGTVTGWTSSIAQTTAIMNFLSTAPLSDFRFNAGGVTNSTNGFDDTLNRNIASWFTASTPTTIDILPNTSSGVNTVQSNTDGFIVQINNAYATTEVITGLNPGEQGFHTAPLTLWGNQVGGSLGNSNTEANVTEDLPVYELYSSCTGFLCEGFSVGQQGFLSIDTATGEASWNLTPPVSAVPVPAAAWLLGSGLVGLVGVARRRTA
jgi:hypothetical protein